VSLLRSKCRRISEASWISGKENADVPQLKGARWFSLEEIQRCTNNFSQSNEIGAGGYGKVNHLQTFHQIQSRS
jgi:hypothetical protein